MRYCFERDPMFLGCLYLLFFVQILGCFSCEGTHTSTRNALMESARNHYPIIFLEDIKDRDCFLRVKGGLNFDRKVYFDKESRQYVKIWSKNYAYAPCFMEAVNKSFFEGIAPIKYIIFDKQFFCRGYITTALNDFQAVQNNLVILNGRILSISRQNDAFKIFFEHLKMKILATKLIYLDLTPANVCYDGSNYYLVDLEAVFNVARCKKNFLDFKHSLLCNPPEYIVFVNHFLKKS